MLSDNDKQILNKLKDEYPEAYELFERREEEHRRLLKQGCHDIRNIVTLLSGSYQLLGLTNPQLNSIPRYVTMGSDIKNLVKAFNDFAMYRYAAYPHPMYVYTISSQCWIHIYPIIFQLPILISISSVPARMIQSHWTQHDL